MSISTAVRRSSAFGAVLFSAVALATMAGPSQPAKAQTYFGFGFGPVTFGVASAPAYYNYPYYYPPAYSYNYRYPYNYRYYYPSYSYYYPSYTGYYYPTYW